MRNKEIYGVIQHWIMTVKDHFTGLIYIVALPNKKASFIAYELEKFFGFIEYPNAFHSKKGKKFTASSIVVVALLKGNHPH
jgi:hypothetical protein